MKEFMTYEMSLLERELNSEQLGLLLGRNQEKESVALKMFHKGSSIDNIHDLTDFPLERIKPLASNIFSWFVPFLCYNIISLKTKGLIFLDIKFLSVKQKKQCLTDIAALIRDNPSRNIRHFLW